MDLWMYPHPTPDPGWRQVVATWRSLHTCGVPLLLWGCTWHGPLDAGTVQPPLSPLGSAASGPAVCHCGPIVATPEGKAGRRRGA